MFEVAPVDPETLTSVKHIAWPFLVKGAEIDDGRTSPAEIWGELQEQNSKLWFVIKGDEIKAIVVTCFINYPEFRALKIELCVGDEIKKWLHLLADIEKWAKDRGASVVELTGRRGWTKYLPQYKLRRVLMTRNL